MSETQQATKPKKVYKRKVKYFTAYEEKLPSADGKNIVITGTSSGTGLVACQTALKKGAVVALLNRNEEKAKKALETFFAENEGTEERAHFVYCDLQDFETVKAAAEEVKELFKDGIDVLVNNAGIAALEDKPTKDGYEIQMQTNHLSHFLLTKELFELLDKRAEEVGEARVVNHSSSIRLAPSGLKAKYMRKGLSGTGKLGGNGKSMMTGGRWERYHQSKLANSVFTVELQKRLNKANSKVLSLCAHPGMAATGMPDKIVSDGGLKSSDMLDKQAQTVEDGTLGLARCMLGTKVKKGALYGPRFMKGKATKRFHGPGTTSKAGRILWRESEEACGKFVVGTAV